MPKGVGRSGDAWTLGPVGGANNMVGFRIQGIETVAAGINEVLMKMKAKSMNGLIAAANVILVDADSGHPPLVPHDLGILRSSRFVEPLSSQVGDPAVVLGYSANYAAAVHEMVMSPSGKPINWQRPGSGDKFLEKSLKRNADLVPVIVQRFVNAGL